MSDTATPKPRRSLLSKVILGVSLAIVSIVAIVVVPTSVLYRRELVEQRRDALRFSAAILVHHRGQDLATKGQDALDDLAREIEGHAGELSNRLEQGAALVFDPSGKLVAASPGAVPDPAPACCDVVSRAVGERAAEPVDAEHDGVLHLVVPVRGGKEGAVVGYLLVSTSLEDVRTKVLKRLLLAAGTTLVLLLSTGLAVIYALSKHILKPLGALTDANRALVEGDEKRALVPEAGIPDDELGDAIRVRNEIYAQMLEYQRSIRDKNEVLSRQKQELRRSAIELEKRVRDKTQELERVYERLLETEKLAATGRLAAGVAHELNNPLASIAGYAEDLLELARAPELAALKEFGDFPESLHVIEEQAYRCKKIIRQLLTYARPSAYKLEPLEIGALAADVLPLVEHKVKGRDIPIVLDVEPDTPRVLGDRTSLQQVLVNLLENALDAIKVDKGQVTVRAGPSPAEPGTVEVAVTDTGAGIPAAIRAKVFEPFFSTKPAGHGTGLGLSICHGIVSRLHGRIALESEEGRGTTVRVRLPAAPAEVPAEAAAR